jgi:hypothetical protein
MAVYTVSISDGTTLSNLAVSAGRGPKGDGWTSVIYDNNTGRFTFTSNDGLGYVSDSITADLDTAVTDAEAAQAAAEAAQATENIFDQFGDQYLGPKASDPTVDNDGDPLTEGDIYFNTTDDVLKFYSGTAWVAPESIATTAATAAQTAATEAQGYADSINPDNIDINGGTIDGTVIGGTTAAAGTFSSATVNGNITVTGTVDGRDVASDGSKLDGIESGADVTDTANVTAAGALMDSELTSEASVKALDQGVATTDSPDFAGITATEGTFSRLNVGANLEWNASTDTYTANTTPSTVTKALCLE